MWVSFIRVNTAGAARERFGGILAAAVGALPG